MGEKILLVEDDKILIDMYQKLLSNHGYGVDLAMDGVEGLKKAIEGRPALILLDIKMPKMDGMTMLKLLRENDWGKSAKVIILTNLDASDAILSEVVKDQPAYYLIKSNTKPEQVIEHVKEVLGEVKN
jgi:CheY-like chemotaxis protein